MHEIAAGFLAFAGARGQLPDGVTGSVAAVASAVMAELAVDGAAPPWLR
jgi:hypothetical protein